MGRVVLRDRPHLPPTDPAKKHQGLSYLLVPMDQDGIEIRPIRQLTGTSEFNEVFFDGARTSTANVVGGEGNGWKVAMGTLAFERGASTLGQQLQFDNELRRVTELARKTGRLDEPVAAPAAGRRLDAGCASCAGTRCGCSPAPPRPSCPARR